MVSILGEHEPYEFPKPMPLELRLKDVLESEVDEKFYLSQKIQDRLTLNLNFKNEIKTIGSTKGKENTRAGQRDIVYSDEGIMGALGATDYKQPKQILDNKIKQIGQYDTANRKNKSAYRVYDSQGISPTLSTMQGGGRQPSVVVDSIELPAIGASRGRYPENPSDSTVGSPTEQRLEINKQGTSNTITTVQKDNYVVEPKDESVIIDDTMGFEKEARVYADYSPSLRASRSGLKTIEEQPSVEGVDVHPFSKKLEFRGYKRKEVSPCLLATDYKAHKTILEPQTNSFRIRKLTPKECWRLMGFSDDDFHKAEEVNSNTQLYKQAGNSIVVDVLEAIFKQLLED